MNSAQMGPYLWFAARATGVVSIVFFTTVFVLGMLTSSRNQPFGPSQTIIQSLHRALSLGLVLFLGIHVVLVVTSSHNHMGFLDSVVPFLSHHETLWRGLGTLAVDFFLAAVGTSLLRHRVPEKLWRPIHLAAYLCWPAAVVHSYALGTPDQPWLRGTTMACAAIGMGAGIWRLWATSPDTARRTSIAAQEWS